ncbi:DUF4360 domain-containing protein [Streptomyces carminius]|uniref:DUF4360 domain-containing protein n=1 Tax=Streptomyces carminius TaxID=2665496 RepID=A0A2M8M1G4_9ACTN|nr:DUF4360 domain-containing protein [Streptomyces carminius]PJE98044.1 DUF4360 domain-containing protein [Streptomyces carminius]PJF01870.1 DUF4360 domain-containing protein [Streptomyces carminius]
MLGVLAAGGTVAALSASLLSPQAAPAETTAPPAGAAIEVATVNGSGCPAGTAGVTVSGRDSFTVTYDDYLVQVGPVATPTEFRKNCQISLEIAVPAGYTYAISGVQNRGYAYLQSGASALQQTTYYIQGSAGTVTTSQEFDGPYRSSWSSTDSLGSDELVWAPCGQRRNLNINTELRVYSGSSSRDAVSFMAMRSTSTAGSSFDIVWKQC